MKMSDLTPEGQRTLSRYVDRNWFDAGGDDRLRDVVAGSQLPRPAYLVLASGLRVPPLSEVAVTTRCHYRPFRGRRMVIASTATTRFDLIDLRVVLRSQFRRDESLPLRGCVDEIAPELIQWPLEVCGAGGDVVARAIIPAGAAGAEEDLGAELELILIGEVM